MDEIRMSGGRGTGKNRGGMEGRGEECVPDRGNSMLKNKNVINIC